MSWFEELMGFPERDGVQAHAEVKGERLISRVDGRAFGCGRLETPSLAELGARLDAAGPIPGRPTLREVVADVQSLHRDPKNAGAVFQAASQFNLLEMSHYTVTPERGVTIYAHDHTQGPACAIACGAGTIYRNHFAPVGDGIGQTADRQIDCLADLERALGEPGAYWTMRNGYALLTEAGRTTLARALTGASPARRAELRGLLRIGVHHDVEVTLGGAGHLVTQIYGSALPVAYGDGPPDGWAPLARLVLDASYEATLYAAALEARRTGKRAVFLTLLGGGVFGNAPDWILSAIERALAACAARGGGALDVAIVSYGRAYPPLEPMARKWNSQ